MFPLEAEVTSRDFSAPENVRKTFPEERIDARRRQKGKILHPNPNALSTSEIPTRGGASFPAERVQPFPNQQRNRSESTSTQHARVCTPRPLPSRWRPLCPPRVDRYARGWNGTAHAASPPGLTLAILLIDPILAEAAPCGRLPAARNFPNENPPCSPARGVGPCSGRGESPEHCLHLHR